MLKEKQKEPEFWLLNKHFQWKDIPRQW